MDSGDFCVNHEFTPPVAIEPEVAIAVCDEAVWIAVCRGKDVFNGVNLIEFMVFAF